MQILIIIAAIGGAIKIIETVWSLVHIAKEAWENYLAQRRWDARWKALSEQEEA